MCSLKTPECFEIAKPHIRVAILKHSRIPFLMSTLYIGFEVTQNNKATNTKLLYNTLMIICGLVPLSFDKKALFHAFKEITDAILLSPPIVTLHIYIQPVHFQFVAIVFT